MRSVNRKFATILATDCVGFSKHMLENEEGTLESLNACREIIDAFIAKHGGRIFHTAGDSVLAEFASPVESVNCAINFQDAISERNKSIAAEAENAENDTMLIWRVGIHCDDVIVEKDNVYGNGVNIAARLEAQCTPGQILVSRLINEQVASRIEAISRAAGTKKLKNISSEFEVFTISTDQTASVADVVEAEEEKEDIKRDIKPILSVLPFKNMNANEDSSFLIDGIYEDILTELSMVRQLSIVSRQSSVNFAGSDDDLDDFIKQFKVNYMIQGSVRSSGNKVRVTVSLIETDANEILWSKRFDRSIDDIFEVQDEIVRSVTQEILGEIELVSLQRAKRKPTENMSSYEFLLKGKEMHHQFESASNKLALEMFDAAIAADPNNAQAYAWKACTLGQGMARGFIQRTFEELVPEFSKLLDTAIKIDANDFECHRLLSAVYSGTGKLKLAVEHGKKAYDMVPNDPRILQQYGEALLKTGGTKKGCDLTLLALEYDPVPQGQTNSDKRKADAVFACFMDDRIDQGLALAEEIESRDGRTLLCAAALAVEKFSGLADVSWLLNDLKATDAASLEPVIDSFGQIDLVVQSTLREVFVEHMAPHCKIAA
ncbi:MAG: adenylate/guanylate cyclase domain-containing protein [Paracoccaceae bacterium]